MRACVHPLPRDPVTHPCPLSLGHHPNWLLQPLRPIIVCSPLPPPQLPLSSHTPLLSSCLALLQTCYRFSQFCILTHCMHICGGARTCWDWCGELGMSKTMSGAQPPSSWHPAPLHMLLFMSGMPSLLFCLEDAQPSISSSKVTLSISLCQLSWTEPSSPTFALIISACNYLLSKSVSPWAVSICRAGKLHCVSVTLDTVPSTH